MRGQAYCKNHVGKTRELAKAQGEVNLLAWSARAGGDEGPLDLGRTVMDQLRVAVMRAELLGRLLQSEVAVEGGHRVKGLVARKANDVRALVKLEASERDRVVRIAKTAHDMGIDEQHVQIAQRDAERVIAAQQMQLDLLHRELAGGLPPALRSRLIEVFLVGIGIEPEALEAGGAA